MPGFYSGGGFQTLQRVCHEHVGQDLDGDVAIEPRVPRLIDLAHAAGAEGGDDLVRAEASAGNEGQTLAVDYTVGAPPDGVRPSLRRNEPFQLLVPVLAQTQEWRAESVLPTDFTLG